MDVPRRLFWTTFGTGAAAVATIVAVLVWFAAQTDANAQRETLRRVQATVELTMQQVALITRDYGDWAAPFEWYRDGDDAALYDNVGTGATESDAFDLLYLFAADGTPTHVYVSDGEESSPDDYLPQVGAALLPGMMAAPLTPYDVRGGLVAVGEDIAIVMGGRIQPDDLSALGPEDIPYLIGGIWLDPGRLGASLMLNDLVLLPPGADLGPLVQSMPLTGVDGSTIGQLVWPAPRPGRHLLVHTAPVVAMLVVMILGGSWMVGRMARQQTAAYLREWHSARTDPVTGVLNRTGLNELAAGATVQAALDAGRAAVLYIDLNGVKALNDTFGHRAGDAAIQITADRLVACLQEGQSVARIGGDEFVCLVIDDHPRAAALHLAAKYIALSQQTFVAGEKTCLARASIGIAISAPDISWSTLLGQADAAMYQAKRQQRIEPVVFSKPLLAAV